MILASLGTALGEKKGGWTWKKKNGAGRKAPTVVVHFSPLPNLTRGCVRGVEPPHRLWSFLVDVDGNGSEEENEIKARERIAVYFNIKSKYNYEYEGTYSEWNEESRREETADTT